jgi:hypothetical protein
LGEKCFIFIEPPKILTLNCHPIHL